MGLFDKVKNPLANKHSDNIERQNLGDVTPNVPDANHAEQRKIDDILDLLQIPPTFEIPGEVFLPEDLKQVHFDIQVPSGYDESQVKRFVLQASNSIKFFTELLKTRNEHIAKLATTIDRLQVDTNNLKFEREMANGISVMPTEGDAGVEAELMESKLQIRRLEDQLRNGAGNNGLSDTERESYAALQDELSLANRRVRSLEDDVLQLKNHIAILEDAADDELAFNQPQPTLTDEELLELGVPTSALADMNPKVPTNGLPDPTALPIPKNEEPRKLSLPNTSTVESLDIYNLPTPDADYGFDYEGTAADLTFEPTETLSYGGFDIDDDEEYVDYTKQNITDD